MDGEHPKPIDPGLLLSVDRVVVVGEEAVVEPVPGMAGVLETWVIDEPSTRGIEGEERSRSPRRLVTLQLFVESSRQATPSP